MADEIAAPMPILKLAEAANTPLRTIEKYMKLLREDKPELFTIHESKGPYLGVGRIQKLYSPQLIPYLLVYKPKEFIIKETETKTGTKRITQRRAEKREYENFTIEKAQPKKKLVPPKGSGVKPEKEKPKTIEEEVVDLSDQAEQLIDDIPAAPDNIQQKGYFHNTAIKWSDVVALLEVGGTKDEVAAMLKINPSVLESRCPIEMNMTFSELSNFCFHSGNMRLKMSLFASAVGSKNRKVNPLIQGLLAKERLRFGEVPQDAPVLSESMIEFEGKVYNLEEMTEFEREDLYNKIQNAEQQLLEISNGDEAEIDTVGTEAEDPEEAGGNASKTLEKPS